MALIRVVPYYKGAQTDSLVQEYVHVPEVIGDELNVKLASAIRRAVMLVRTSGRSLHGWEFRVTIGD